MTMDASAVATIAAALVAALAALTSAWFAQRSAAASRMHTAEALAVKFREPLLQAAFNLQTRIYNILRQGFLRKFTTGPHPERDVAYSIDNTLYLFGQYFCWVEILRRESQFLDPRSRERERAVADQLEKIRDAFASSDVPGATLRIFRGEQRAIGEVLLEPAGGDGPGVARWDCMGYASFVERLGSERLDRWFSPLRADIEAIRSDPGLGRARLVLVQHALLTLVEILDPEAGRTSGRMRERL
ncbi:hypothetical protein N865_01790 [Intrasporangium oryzae NRRL B-24470]|uniref:Uncharacterized protein n=1 Tax=Intrasporangium oryzae NRRL B-24470 TaxID=1386089 RepID=W9GDC3_9MICO|nr:hypothetical protein N865_01790 [Intrasporangium oryzae NRRL B-24470]